MGNSGTAWQEELDRFPGGQTRAILQRHPRPWTESESRIEVGGAWGLGNAQVLICAKLRPKNDKSNPLTFVLLTFDSVLACPGSGFPYRVPSYGTRL